MRHAKDENAWVYPSLNRLANLSGFHKRTIQRALKELESDGWILKRTRTPAHLGVEYRAGLTFLHAIGKTEPPDTPAPMDTVSTGVVTQTTGGSHSAQTPTALCPPKLLVKQSGELSEKLLANPPGSLLQIGQEMVKASKDLKKAFSIPVLKEEFSIDPALFKIHKSLEGNTVDGAVAQTNSGYDMATVEELLHSNADPKEVSDQDIVGVSVEKPNGKYTNLDLLWKKACAKHLNNFQPALTAKQKGQLQQMAAKVDWGDARRVILGLVRRWPKFANLVSEAAGVSPVPSVPSVAFALTYIAYAKKALESGAPAGASKPVSYTYADIAVATEENPPKHDEGSSDSNSLSPEDLDDLLGGLQPSEE